jgi:MFS family permease
MASSNESAATASGGTAAQTGSGGRWSPLRRPRFRRVAFAGAGALSGYWMTEVACAWQMRLLSDADPLRVALVGATLQLTLMTALIPAGIVADVLDRRRLLLLSHAGIAALLALMAALAFSGLLTGWLLLALLPLLALGQAIRMPIIGSLVVETVARDEVAAAVSVNALGQNGSRVLGPALAGVLIGLAGAPAALAVAAVLLAVTGLVLAGVPQGDAARTGRLDLRRFVDELRAERSYVASTPWKRNLMLRLGLFFVCTSAVPSLLPVRFGSGPLYGTMLAVYGVGAFAGLLVLGRPRSSRTLEQRAQLAQVLHAAGLVLLGATSALPFAALALAVCGACWLAASNSLVTAAQLQLPGESRGRGLAVIYAVGMAGLAAGGPLWGAIARGFGIGPALVAAGVASVAIVLSTRRLRFALERAADGA